MKSKYFQYYVEGDNEKKIINVLKTEMQCIIAGKVETFNAVNKEFKNDAYKIKLTVEYNIEDVL